MASTTLSIIIDAKDKATGTFKGLESSLGAFGTALGGLAGGAAALGGIGLALGKLAIDAAPLEQVKAAFDGIAAAAGTSGDKMLAALQKGSQGMVTNASLMMSFNKAASLVSADFAQKLPEAMQYLTKVSAATGQDMGFMLDSLVTGVGRLSPMILDNLGIQVSLEEATARAAAQFGVEADQLTKAQTQAGMMTVILEKLQANTAAIPDATGSAAQSFAQFGTTMQNLKDQVGMQLLPVITPMLAKLSEAATSILPLIIARFGEFSATLSATMGPAMLVIGDAWTRILAVFGQTATSMTPTQVLLTALGGVLDALVIGVQAFAVVMQGVAWAVEKVSEAVQIAIGIYTNLMAIFEKVGEAIQIAIGVYTNLMAILSSDSTDPAVIAIQALAGAFESLVSPISAAYSLWQTFSSAVSSFSLPDVLTPGSPTPMELGLRGIADALKNIGPLPSAPQAAGAGGGGFGSMGVNLYLDGRQISQTMVPTDAQRGMGGPSPL